jgi:glycosyltransferase involved in cell wall biosynthesis
MEKATEIKGKKILYLVTQTKWGGAQKYVLELAQYFSQNNEVHIAYGETKDINEKFLNLAKQNNIHTIPIHKLVRNIDISQDLFAIPEILKILNKESYHLLHLNSSKAGLLGAIAAQAYNINPLNPKMRVVYTAHGFVFNEPLKNHVKKLYKVSETFSTGLQHLTIAVSKHDKASATSNKISSPHKIFVVHNGINPAKYNFLEKYQAQAKLNLDPKKKYFGTIASFYPTKGHHYLIEAVKMLKAKKSPLLTDYLWVLIGSGPEQTKIEQLIKTEHLETYFKIIPAQDNDWQYLKAFDCFILPSVKEGLPYTILEAGLAQIPLIATTVGGIPEIIVNEQTGLLTASLNPLALSEAMEKIVSQPELAAKLAEQNLQNIQTNFSLDKTLHETEELYLKLF